MSLCCVKDFVRLLDTSQWIESVELRSKVVSVLVELARCNPTSSAHWDGRTDFNVWVNELSKLLSSVCWDTFNTTASTFCCCLIGSFSRVTSSNLFRYPILLPNKPFENTELHLFSKNCTVVYCTNKVTQIGFNCKDDSLVYWFVCWSWSTNLLYKYPRYYLDGWLSVDR